MLHWWGAWFTVAQNQYSREEGELTRPMRLPMPHTTEQFRTMVKTTMMMSDDFGRGAEIGSGSSSTELISESDV